MNDRDRSDKETRRSKAKEARSRRRDRAGTVDIETVDWLPLCALIAEMSRRGGAVRIGYTRDGGAYALGCYMGDDYGTEYVRPSEDFGAAIAEIAEAWLPDGGAGYVELLEKLRRLQEAT